MLSILQSCSPLTTLKLKPIDGNVSVPRDQFTKDNNIVIIKNFDHLDFDIAVIQYAEDTFKAFELQCTHQPNYALTATKEGFFCSAHGSLFDFNGQVKKAPAKKPMKEYPIEITNQIIKITI